MRIYKDNNVIEESRNRIRWLFDEFDEVVVTISSGKDSTVVLELALEIAKEKGRLPLDVKFIDQELEWQSTVDYISDLYDRPEINMNWYQIPLKETTAVSSTDSYVYCWDESVRDKWVREKDERSIHDNTYGTDRFAQLFTNIIDKEYPDKTVAVLAGVRGEESPSRYMGLTQDLTYKWVTWGKRLNSSLGHHTFYPIYDWSYTDVWKSIHDNKWTYNPIYDIQYRYGIQVKAMRVSSLTHETAVRSLFYLQESEPETYDRIVNRLGGVDTAGKMGTDDFFIDDLPFMFKDWKEYRDYLLPRLIPEQEGIDRMSKQFARMDDIFAEEYGDTLYKSQVQAIVSHDTECVKLDNWANAPGRIAAKRKHNGRKGNKERWEKMSKS